jgi:hypothetical protein
MKELKVAVSISGRIAILERFPDDEEHAGLHEMLLELELSGIEGDEPAGLYMATFYIDQTNPPDPSDIETYLEIEKLETIPDYFERICLTDEQPLSIGNSTNVVNLNEVRVAKASDENLQHCVSAWNTMTPEQAQEQAVAEKNWKLERQHAAALNKHITIGDEWDNYDIYLRTKIGTSNLYYYVGLHAIGHAGQYDYTLTNLDKSVEHKSTDFQPMEVWGNEYDSITGEMIGRGSFRIHTNDLESVAKEYESEGWERTTKPGKK